MSETTTITISPGRSRDAAVIGDALGEAFQQDPVLSWIVPDTDRRRARLGAVFTAFAELYLPHGETYVIGDGVGAALCTPPEIDAFSGEAGETFGERMAEILGPDVDRVAVLDETFAVHHPDEPCLYMQFMGVRSDHQGRGLGGRLLASVLTGCDRTGTPAYLEATSPANRRLYERYGFETVSEFTLPEGPPLWSMWRDPPPRSAR